MYHGPTQQFPPPAPVAPRRTGRTVGITIAMTLGVYVLVVGVAGAVIAGTGSGSAAGPEFEGLPTEPCSAASGSQLGSLSAMVATASFSEVGSSCQWYVEYSDGTQGTLSVRYRIPTDDDREPLRGESNAQDQYAKEADALRDGEDGDYWTQEILEARDLDLGDESVVSHYRTGSGELNSQAEVLVRSGGVLVAVEAAEVWEQASGRADFTEDEETLIAIAENALTLVE